MTAVEMATQLRQRAMRAFPLGHPHQIPARQRLNAVELTAWDDPKDYSQADLESAWHIIRMGS